jgi:hypothetical protein
LACQCSKFHISLECSMNGACRIRAKIAPTPLSRRTIFGGGLCDSGRGRERRDSLAMAIERTENACSGRRNCPSQINAALFRRHFFRFVPACSAVNAVVWNHLKRRFFLLHPVSVLHIQEFNPSASASPSHDSLFLQRFHRPRRTQRRERGADAAAHAGANLWVSGLQRPVRPMRPHYQEDHGRSARRLRQVLLLGMPAQPDRCGTTGSRRVCAGRFLIPKKPCQYRPLLFGQCGVALACNLI